MFELKCTVRKCQETLQPNDRGLTCAAGHHFDRAKQGYWNLLQPQDRKSSNPGDNDDAVLARHRWLQRGYATGLIEALAPWCGLAGQTAIAQGTADATQVPRTIDLGCGEGTFGPALFAEEALGYCGVDLSKRAIKMAARSWPQATWVLANADRILPASDGSVDRVISLFGRRPIAEIRRVLRPGGSCIVAVPGEDDLIQLRQTVQTAGHRRSRWEVIVDEMTEGGLLFIEHRRWHTQVTLAPDAIADALAMTYRAVRHSQQSRLQSVDQPMDVTLSADLILLRHLS